MEICHANILVEQLFIFNRGVIGGGSDGSTTNAIDYITLGTTGTSFDFGDLTSIRTNHSCTGQVKQEDYSFLDQLHQSEYNRLCNYCIYLEMQ